MVEEKHGKLNLKKKKLDYSIYYGMDVSTGKMVSVDEVDQGLACNCVCPSCGTRLEACKGKIISHYFRHERNKECLYGAEISIYLAFYELLKEKKRFYIPDAILEMNYGRDRIKVKKGSLLELTKITFENDMTNYPPELLCYVGDASFRIVLNVESYYDDSDVKKIKAYGKQRNCPIVFVNIYDVDRISDLLVLQEYIDSPNWKKWIYNRWIEREEQKYLSKRKEVRNKQLTQKNEEKLNNCGNLPDKSSEGIPIRYVNSVEQLGNENYDQEDYLVVDQRVNLRYLKCMICNRVVKEQDVMKKETLNNGICVKCYQSISKE